MINDMLLYVGTCICMPLKVELSFLIIIFWKELQKFRMLLNMQIKLGEMFSNCK